MKEVKSHQKEYTLSLSPPPAPRYKHQGGEKKSFLLVLIINSSQDTRGPQMCLVHYVKMLTASFKIVPQTVFKIQTSKLKYSTKL